MCLHGSPDIHVIPTPVHVDCRVHSDLYGLEMDTSHTHTHTHRRFLSPCIMMQDHDTEDVVGSTNTVMLEEMPAVPQKVVLIVL